MIKRYWRKLAVRWCCRNSCITHKQWLQLAEYFDNVGFQSTKLMYLVSVTMPDDVAVCLLDICEAGECSCPTDDWHFDIHQIVRYEEIRISHFVNRPFRCAWRAFVLKPWRAVCDHTAAAIECLQAR